MEEPDAHMKAGHWIVAILLVLSIIGLLSFARGPEHRRGDEVGALRRSVVSEAA
jgi:hypothetical protein